MSLFFNWYSLHARLNSHHGVTIKEVLQLCQNDFAERLQTYNLRILGDIGKISKLYRIIV